MDPGCGLGEAGQGPRGASGGAGPVAAPGAETEPGRAERQTAAARGKAGAVSDAGTWARFRVGGLDDEDGNATQPVQVVCTECREVSPYFTYRDDGGADRTAPLDDLITWVQHHSCY